MDWGFLSFLGEPWFVLPWYAVGALGAAYLVHDLRTANTPLKPAMKWAWPIIVLFFSVIGLALCFGTARAPEGKRGREEGGARRVRAADVAARQRSVEPLCGGWRIRDHDRHGDRPRRGDELLAGVLVMERESLHRLLKRYGIRSDDFKVRERVG